MSTASNKQRTNSSSGSLQRHTRVCFGSVRGRKRAVAMSAAWFCTRLRRCHQTGSSNTGSANHQSAFMGDYLDGRRSQRRSTSPGACSMAASVNGMSFLRHWAVTRSKCSMRLRR